MADYKLAGNGLNPSAIATLTLEVENAARALEEARGEESRAASAACTAVNNYNAATKALDAALAKLRAAAPRGSDWADQGTSRRVG